LGRSTAESADRGRLVSNHSTFKNRMEIDPGCGSVTQIADNHCYLT
jgi:hypothetical protein